MTDFASLGLAAPLLRAVADAGYTTPTPIQARAIPIALAGRDVLGLAQTGTGKTAAFALPILQRLSATPKRPASKTVRALILVPTRELAVQVDEGFRAMGAGLPLRRAVVIGGVGQQPQVNALARGLDVLVATPGRLMDLIDQRHARLDAVEVLVLDEADRMLDLGFIRDIRRIAALVPAVRHTMLFSATMPAEVAGLARELLTEPEEVSVAPPATTAEKVDQAVLFVRREDKRALLVDLLEDPAATRTIVFCRTKHGADRVAGWLEKAGIAAAAIHGNKSQNNRQRALNGFKDGGVRVLVATDIAARGIDVRDVSHVVNFELPNEPESYVHRIGRTARAGAAGIALSLCDRDEVDHLRGIEKAIRMPVPVRADHAWHAAEIAAAHAAPRGRGGPAPQGASRKPQQQARPARPQSHQGGGRPQGHGGQGHGGRPAGGSAPIRRPAAAGAQGHR
jgi:ATP-dependent RNA helicase RhlE